jgi:SAM-dependent methyltransferase
VRFFLFDFEIASYRHHFGFLLGCLISLPPIAAVRCFHYSFPCTNLLGSRRKNNMGLERRLYMKTSSQEMKRLREATSAGRKLGEWIAGARVFALLSRAVDTGMIEMLRKPCSLEEIATATGLSHQDTLDMCLALEAHGIVKKSGIQYQLTPDYALLASENAAVPLSSLIQYSRVLIRGIQEISPKGSEYTKVMPEDVLAIAEGSGISALSFAPFITTEILGVLMPEVAASWESAAYHLEVGCGVGNVMFGIVRTYPGVKAVGIEIDETTASETERRMNLLGISDRVTLRCMDACQLTDEGCFDTVQWSQFFFPTDTRASVLKALHRALKPNGYLFMPLLDPVIERPWRRRGEMLRLAIRALKSKRISFVAFLNDMLSNSPARRRQEDQFAALQRLVFHRWGVPVTSATELAAEITEFGFRVLRAVPTPVSPFGLSRGLLLAQK